MKLIGTEEVNDFINIRIQKKEEEKEKRQSNISFQDQKIITR